MRPVYKDLSRETRKMVFIDRWPLWQVPVVHVLMRNNFQGKLLNKTLQTGGLSIQLVT